MSSARAFLIALMLTLFGAAVPAAATDLLIPSADRFIIAAKVNGQTVRLRVDPEAPGFIVLNPDVARRIGLRPSLLDVEAIIGPVHLPGHTKVAAIELGGRRFDRRVAWVPGQAALDADGLVSPANLPVDRVTIEIGPRAVGEREHVLAMNYTREHGLRLPLRVGDQVVHFLLTTNKARSMATAAAGAQLAAVHGGAGLERCRRRSSNMASAARFGR